MRRARRWIVIAASAPILVVASYFAVAAVLGLVAIDKDYRPAEPGIDVFVRTNGVHADLIVPVSAAGIAWNDRLPLDSIPSGVSSGGYLAIGWGDRGFYLATPRWSDLRLTTALSALTGLDTTVLHVEAIDAAPIPGPRSRHVRVTPDAYRRLAAFVMASFAVDANAARIVVPRAHYGSNDAFFHARGRYSIVLTCNEWTRRALAAAGVRVPMWSPFDTALLLQLPIER